WDKVGCSRDEGLPNELGGGLIAERDDRQLFRAWPHGAQEADDLGRCIARDDDRGVVSARHEVDAGRDRATDVDNKLAGRIQTALDLRRVARIVGQDENAGWLSSHA